MKERLKQLRKELHLSQQEFAEKIGINRGTLANYEVGRNEPIDAVIKLICERFHVSEVWLRTGEGEMFVRVSKEDEILSLIKQSAESETIKRRFAAAIMNLSPEQIRKCIDWICDNLTQMPEDDTPSAVDIKPKK